MNTKELLDAGQLSAAIEQLNQEVRSQPADSRRRTFLFELLCFTGDYQRAERQLDVIAHQSPAADLGIQVYRQVLAAEKARARLFSESLCPDFLFLPPAYVYAHLEAVNRLREGDAAAAMALIEASERSRPLLQGRMQGQPFSDFRDGDDLLAPCLEVFLRDKYVWLPLEQVKSVEIAAPQRLRDLLWIPARIECHDGPVGEVFLPVLYAGSNTHPDDRVKLGRMTDWKTVPEGPTLGVGQRLFYIDGQDRGILEVRQVEFEAPASQSAAP
jgi:type VI secretion system protein ImpE